MSTESKWEKLLGDDAELRTALLEQERNAAESAALKAAEADSRAQTTGAFKHEEVAALAESSLDFLAALAMPTVYRFGFPPVLQQAWAWLISYANVMRVFPQLALGLPRGFAKSTVIKLFVLFVILFTKRRFILVTCANATLAENIIADVIGYLDEPNIKATFGDWRLGVIKDTQHLKRFGFRGRDIIIAALGQGGSLRGMNLGNERPDVEIFDDVQTRECADSQVESEALEKWIYGTALKAKSPFGCIHIFIANMYPTKFSILRKLKSNPTWTKFIVGGILADGTSLWEDLHPIAQLLEECRRDTAAGHPEIFHSEVLNDENASVNALLNVAKLPEYPFDDDDPTAGRFIIIDPSNDKWNSDAVSLGYFEIHDTKPALIECIEGRFSPGGTIKEAVKLALRTKTQVVAIESNAFQYSLLYWSDVICKQLGISGIHFVDVYSGKRSKNSRILDMFKSLTKGEIHIHPKARNAVFSQVISFQPLKTNNVDGLLDLLTYAPKVIELYGSLITSFLVIEDEDFGRIEVWDATENCAF